MAAVVDHDNFHGLVLLGGEGEQQLAQTGSADRRHDDTPRLVLHARTSNEATAKSGRRRTNGPMAIRSIGALPNSSKASCGVSTIGRPAVLRLVLTRTGTPVRRSNSARSLANKGCSAASPVCTRAVPSTWTTAAIRSRHAGRTWWTKSMYGLGIWP